jgi:hypothetical protein
LFKKYLEIKENGTFEAVMEEVYKKGAITNFRPPAARQRVASSEFLQ